MRLAVSCLLLSLSGCLIELEADPVEPRGIAPVERDATVDQDPPDACIAAPTEARRDDVPVGEVAAIPVPLGCGPGLRLTAVFLDDVTPEGAFQLDASQDVLVSPVPVLYTPRQIGEVASGLLYAHTEHASFAIPLRASSRWTDAACRPWRVFAEDVAIEERPVVRLDAQPPVGVARTAASVLWSVLEQPEGAAAAAFAETINFDDPAQDRPDDPATPGAWYPLLEPGSYLFECTIKPPAGAECPAQVTRIRVQRCPCPDDLRVVLTWRTLDDREAPANLNLHLLHPVAPTWGRPGLDCNPQDLDPRWTRDGALERPSHSGEDTIAPGYEQITLPSAEGSDALARPYRIGARVDTAIRVEATARIFLTDRMVWRGTQVLEPGARFWDVAAIGWQGGELMALPIDQVSDEETPDPWAALPAGTACLPGWSPACAGACQINEGALLGRCR